MAQQTRHGLYGGPRPVYASFANKALAQTSLVLAGQTWLKSDPDGQTWKKVAQIAQTWLKGEPSDQTWSVK